MNDYMNEIIVWLSGPEWLDLISMDKPKQESKRNTKFRTANLYVHSLYCLFFQINELNVM